MIVKNRRNLLNFLIFPLNILNFQLYLSNFQYDSIVFTLRLKEKIQNTVLPHSASNEKLKPGGKFDDPHCLTKRSLLGYVKHNNNKAGWWLFASYNVSAALGGKTMHQCTEIIHYHFNYN